MNTENQINPLHRWPMHHAARCRARSKRTGLPCRSPAVRGCQVCRMHGAHGGAPTGKANGRYRTGRYTAKLIKARRLVMTIARLVRRMEND
jgi:hypothetical protein